jgi:hypothetical protein
VKKIKKELLDVYTLLLEEEGEVVFIVGDILYHIFLRSDEDFEVRVFRDDLENFLEIDGGCCTGNEREAIEFML